eukprot:c10477_g1_i1 orf=1-297(-)
MMNNCWFQVKAHLCKMSTSSFNVGLSFEHPTVPGNQTGGWMQAASGGAAAAGKQLPVQAQAGNGTTSKAILGRSSSTPALSNRANVRMISNAELKQHNT